MEYQVYVQNFSFMSFGGRCGTKMIARIQAPFLSKEEIRTPAFVGMAKKWRELNLEKCFCDG
jgi:hypothetical protein